MKVLRKVSNVLFIALAANVLVALAKTIYGVATGTLSMVADGIHSFTDAASSVMGLIAVRYASRPSDDDHHYGHYKYETLAALAIGGFIGLTSWEIFKNAIDKLSHHQHPSYHTSGFWIMAVGILINATLSWYEGKKAKEYDSAILKADAYHTASDIWVSCSVFISLYAIRMGWNWVDPALSLVLVFYFLWVAFKLIKENVLILSDAAFISPDEIKQIVLSVDGVLSCHRIRTRGRPGTAFIDLHVQIDATTDTQTAHKIVHQIEERLQTQLLGVKDVLIHTEPYPDLDED